MLKIGVFDSGLGGLTVVQSISKMIKGAELFYIADTLHAPYGEKTSQEILNYSLTITQYFIDIYHIDALVIACNTATSAAVKVLREKYPDLIIIGTEPAIKPAIEQTHTGSIGVLATPATLKSDKYQTLVDKVSAKKKVMLCEQACPGLVEHIENDTLSSIESQQLLEKWLSPMRDAKVDTIVLGCTHYPLASEYINTIMGQNIRLIDSGNAIAKHLLDSLEKYAQHKNEGDLDIYLLYTATINQKIVDKILDKYQKLIHINIK